MRRMDAVRKIWGSFPRVGLLDLLNNRAPLILSTHPGDSILSCGGLIAQCCAAGIIPEVVVSTDGSHSHPGSKAFPPERLRQTREQESQDSLKILGHPSGHTWFLGSEDYVGLTTFGPAFDYAAFRLKGICESTGCKLIIAPCRHETDKDRITTSMLAEHVAYSSEIDLLFYPHDSWSILDDEQVEFDGYQGYQLDISNEIVVKAQSLMTHQTQFGSIITDTGNPTSCEKLMAAAGAHTEIYIAG